MHFDHSFYYFILFFMIKKLCLLDIILITNLTLSSLYYNN